MDLSQIVAALLGMIPAQFATYVLAFCGLCALAAALWPRPPDGSKWLPLYRLVSACGGNFLHAKNASAAPLTPSQQ